MIKTIPYFKSDLNFDVPALLVLSSIVSVWANNFCYLSLMFQHIYLIYTNDKWFYNSSCSTHIILVISTSWALFQGIKTADKKLIRIWHIFRITEIIITIICTVLLTIPNPMPHFEFCPIGILLIVLNTYLVLNVKKIGADITTQDAEVTSNDFEKVSL